MGRPCSTCSHPDHVAIDKKLLGGHEVASLGRKYGIDPSSLRRHKDSHLARPRAAGDVGSDVEFTTWLEQRSLESAADVLTYARFCVFRIERLADKAEADGDIATAVKAIATTLKSMEGLFAKVSGLINDGPAIDASTKVVAVLSGLSEQELRAFLTGARALTAE